MRPVVGLIALLGFGAIGCQAGSTEGTEALNRSDVPVWTPGQYAINCDAETCVVPAGPFMMGCSEERHSLCPDDEKASHEVTVPSFVIDKHEVTVGLYKDCVASGQCAIPGTGGKCNWDVTGKGSHPVNCINWEEARAYCAWAGKRLCSESEWEKASRGTDGREYPWGNEIATCEYAVTEDGGYGCGTDSTMPVGSKPAGASPYGALDMSGNVMEWVEDDWHQNYLGAPAGGDSWIDDPRARFRIIRGGCFGSVFYGDLRSSAREAGTLSYGTCYGIRCCSSAPDR